MNIDHSTAALGTSTRGQDTLNAALAAPAASAQSSVSDKDAQRITAAAVKFESFFVAQMMKQMRQATAALADEKSAVKDRVNDSTLALAEQTVADGMAGHRAFGIADVLVRQLLPQAHVGHASESNTLTRNKV